MRALSLLLAVACCAPLPAGESGATFGLRLRPAPTEMKSVWAPAVIREAPTNEACLLARRDGTLEIYSVTKPASDSVAVIRSRDGGLRWSDPQIAFPLPGQAYYALQVLEAADGALHAVTHILGQGAGYRGRLYEVYHARKPDGAAWSPPRRIVPGYIGSIRGFIQLARSGRLVLAVARAVPEREQAPKTGPDFGWNDTFVFFSDAQGATWRQSPDQLSLELQAPNVTRYGAIEPALLELRDGRVWMLVRDRGGRLWQSFSADGERWLPLARSPFISSDSPAALLRLRDGKIVLFTNACQNWSDPRSYAMGGREVLHAAISADEGKTWRGFREILHEPPVVTRGDRGTAYASAVENSAGKIVVVSGQGEGKRALVAFDPRWLEETKQADDNTGGPVGWSAYGGVGIQKIVLNGGQSNRVAFPAKIGVPSGATWNFPIADAGELALTLDVPRGVSALQLSLTDHFNRVDDVGAAEHAVFSVPFRTDSGERGVRLRWKAATTTGECSLEIDGRPAGRFSAQRPAQFGVNYLRVDFRANAEAGGLTIGELAMQTTR